MDPLTPPLRSARRDTGFPAVTSLRATKPDHTSAAAGTARTSSGQDRTVFAWSRTAPYRRLKRRSTTLTSAFSLNGENALSRVQAAAEQVKTRENCGRGGI